MDISPLDHLTIANHHLKRQHQNRNPHDSPMLRPSTSPGPFLSMRSFPGGPWEYKANVMFTTHIDGLQMVYSTNLLNIKPGVDAFELGVFVVVLLT